MSGDRVLHIGPNNVRLLPAERLLTPIRNPLVLRPALLDGERASFVAALEGLVGRDYNLIRVLELVARLTIQRHLGLRFALPRARRRLPGRSADDDAKSALICSQALLDALAAASPVLRAEIATCSPAVHRLDQRSLGAASIADFLTLHQSRPDLLVEVPLEFPPGQALEPTPGVADVAMWTSLIDLSRQFLVSVVPEIVRDRISFAPIDDADLPLPVVFFGQMALLFAIYRCYPIPTVLAIAGALRRTKRSRL